MPMPIGALSPEFTDWLRSLLLIYAHVQHVELTRASVRSALAGRVLKSRMCNPGSTDEVATTLPKRT